MNHRIGACSLCGGDVMIDTSPYFGHPPPPTCSRCHAVRDEAPEVVPMRQRFYGDDEQRERLLTQGAGNLCMQLGSNTAESQEAGPDDVARWIVEGGFY